MKKYLSKKFLVLGILFLALVYFGVSFYVAMRLVAPYHQKINVSPAIASDDYENITVAGFENTKLQGWLFTAPTDKLVIIVHGITQNRVNTDYYSVLIAKELIANGYNVILYDNRAHGESGGDQITYGIKESKDIIKVVEFAKTKGFAPENIGIIADSLGAFSLLLASDQLKDVGALIVDSSAADMTTAINNAVQKENHIPALFNPGIYFFMKTVYQIDFATVQPIAHIKNIPERKFLFLHGELDKTIPVGESKELLKNANPSSKLVVFPNGSHIETYKSDPQLYRDSVFPFLAEELK